MAVITHMRNATIPEMAKEIDRCHAVIEAYEKRLSALEFYANRQNYVSRIGMDSAISRDNFGDRARAALEGNDGR